VLPTDVEYEFGCLRCLFQARDSAGITIGLRNRALSSSNTDMVQIPFAIQYITFTNLSQPENWKLYYVQYHKSWQTQALKPTATSLHIHPTPSPTSLFSFPSCLPHSWQPRLQSHQCSPQAPPPTFLPSPVLSSSFSLEVVEGAEGAESSYSDAEARSSIKLGVRISSMENRALRLTVSKG